MRGLEGTDRPATPGALVANHGPFTWGADANAAAHHAVILEAIAEMACLTVSIHPEALPIGKPLHDKHYLRKHGKNAYYGQPKDSK